MATASKKQAIHELSIKAIEADGEIQPRGRIDLDVVRDYSDAMLEGDEFPPIVTFFDGMTYWVADGFHRLKAAIKAGRASIRSVVYQGTKDDALLHSVGANASHGIRRTNEDKRRAIMKLLNHREWCRWSDAMIARQCHVSASMVSRYREDSPGSMGHDVTLRVTSNGILRDCSRGGDSSDDGPEESASDAKPPSPPLTAPELKAQYLRRILKALKRTDPSARLSVETPFGVVDLVTGRRQYFLTTAHEAYSLFAAVGKAIALSCLVEQTEDCRPVLIGHFPGRLRKLIGHLREADIVEVVSPEELIRESEA